MSIVVYTVVLGGWDYLRPPVAIEPGVRYLAFVDQPMPPCPPWEFQPAFTPYGTHSRNSRLPKILPHLHFDAEYSVYHDANFALKVPASYLTAYLANGRDIALFEHPCRIHIEQEAKTILDRPAEFPNVDPGEIRRQITRWKHMGAPLGLWAGGLIVRRHNEAVASFNRTWWQEFMAGCSRDQFSLPMARSLTGIEIQNIQGDLFNNPLMAFHWHAAWKDKGDNPAMADRMRPYRDRRVRLEELADRP